jgi:hypothetical protein
MASKTGRIFITSEAIEAYNIKVITLWARVISYRRMIAARQWTDPQPRRQGRDDRHDSR